MKTRYLIFFLVLLNVSCKVTEMNVAGCYQQTQAHNMLKLNTDHTFLYVYYDLVGSMVAKIPIDSCHFCARGTWKLINGKLELNSFASSFSDTARITKISKTPTKLTSSNFSFKDTFGNTIIFNGISDGQSNFAAIADKSYSDYDFDLNKYKTLIFDLYGYNPLLYTVNDTSAADYIITVSPYYRRGYFVNRRIVVKWNRLLDGKTKYKRANPIIDMTSPYVIHGPMHE